jgi:hypothetical protein
MILYKCQTLRHKSYECPKNLHANKRKESKDYVSQLYEGTSNYVIVDNVDDLQ